jgi:hypothetical protein
MRSKRRGLLFGPREAGCWTFLLQQSWLSFAATAGLAWFFPTPLMVGIAAFFMSEALGLTLFLVVVAQLFWASYNLMWLPSGFYQILSWLFLVMMLCPLAHALMPNQIAMPLMLGIISLFGLLLAISLIIRAVMALRDRLK